MMTPLPVHYIGIQHCPNPAIGDFALYNLLTPLDGHPVGSTVSEHTIRRFGFEPAPVNQDE